MRCKKCGDLIQRFLLADGGRWYFRCNNALSGFDLEGTRTHLYPCDCIQDEYGKIVTKGTLLAYITEGTAKIFKVGG